MRRISLKLHNSDGASITFALLLFLVCAVVGSVVLTAATSASGRISKTSEIDQRYYSVTSAAEYLKNSIEGKKIKLEWNEGNNKFEPAKDTDTTAPKFLQSIAMNIADAWPQTSYADGAEKKTFADSISGLSAVSLAPLNLSVSGPAGTDYSGLSATINESLYNDGSLVLDLKSSDGKYSMRMIFGSDLKLLNSTITDYKAGASSVDEIKNETHTLAVSWTLTSLQNGDFSSAPAGGGS